MANRWSEYTIKHRLKRMLARRFFLRFHVTLILLWTFAIGLLTTKGLLLSGVESMAVRYGLAVLVAYIGFLFGVRVWLWYVGLGFRGTDRHDDAFDLARECLPSGSRNAPAETPFRPGGGNFGGGGASGDYTVAPALETELASPLHTVESGSGALESGSGA